MNYKLSLNLYFLLNQLQIKFLLEVLIFPIYSIWFYFFLVYYSFISADLILLQSLVNLIFFLEVLKKLFSMFVFLRRVSYLNILVFLFFEWRCPSKSSIHFLNFYSHIGDAYRRGCRIPTSYVFLEKAILTWYLMLWVIPHLFQVYV